METNTHVDLPHTYTPIASVVVPPGDYVIVANVTVHNHSSPPTTLPVAR